MMTMQLNDGHTMPVMGFGTYKMVEPAEFENSFLEAVRTGYRLFDTAQFYRNEALLGNAIRKAEEMGLVRRKELFITTKVWFTDFEEADCRKSLEESFRLLGLDFIDMVLLHWPYGNIYAAWRVLEEYKEAGRISSIGVSNMTPDRLLDLIHYNRIPPAVNQIEGHLHFQRKDDLAWLKKMGVVPQAYAPLGRGRTPGMFTDPVVERLAQKYGKTAPQLILRLLMQLGFSVIPKSCHPERIRENFAALDFTLEEEDLQALQALDKNQTNGGLPNDPHHVEKVFTWPSRWQGPGSTDSK